VKIIKDIFNRKQIEQDVLMMIESQFGKLTANKLLKSSDKKSHKKLQQIIFKLKTSLKNYISEKQLGVYGISRVLKTVQDEFLEMGIDSEMAKGIVEDIML